MEVEPKDRDALIREKYAGDATLPSVTEDLKRLASGEPLAYVIGNIPFLGVAVGLDSRPLIPRPETEWWAEELVKHVRNRSLRVLDLCAGSGAIGLAILKHCRNAQVSFAELSPEHVETSKKNIERNGLDVSRASFFSGDLFAPLAGQSFDIIATNPPYIPSSRELPDSVAIFEPNEALYAGGDGLEIIRRIIREAPSHLSPSGELWMECDIDNIREAKELLASAGFAAELRTDLYGRERLIVAHLG
jgi:release factor glutamine methyltransferase